MFQFPLSPRCKGLANERYASRGIRRPPLPDRHPITMNPLYPIIGTVRRAEAH